MKQPLTQKNLDVMRAIRDGTFRLGMVSRKGGAIIRMLNRLERGGYLTGPPHNTLTEKGLRELSERVIGKVQMEAIDPFRDAVFGVLDARTDLHHITDADELALELAGADIGFERANIEVLCHCTADWLEQRKKD